MRVLYFDCFSGISGDMTLGALINCGIDAQEFIRQLDKLNIEGYRIEIKDSQKNGITGTDVNVILTDTEHEHHHHQCEAKEVQEEHLHHGHGEHHEHHEHTKHVHNHQGGHEHRNLNDIESIIDNSGLSQRVKDLSKLIFRKLAVAEAKIHGKTVEDIHFHEVGAVDSIVDIVGTAICIDMLKIDKFISAPVNTGMGFVECQHGIIPVPGPAALELLKGVPVYSLDINTELVTPTGAAIISALCESFGPIPPMVVESIGYGSGKKDINIPNFLRVIVGEDKSKQDDVYMLECNIDDMNTEFYDHVMKKLFDQGALDVFMTNIIMKKNRPAVKLSVLANFRDIEKISNVIFTETTTIGIRRYPVNRETLKRRVVDINTRYGIIPVKIAYRNGKAVNYAPEYDAVRNISEKAGVPVKEVYNEAIKDTMIAGIDETNIH